MDKKARDELLARAREAVARNDHLPATHGDIRRIEQKLDVLLEKLAPEYYAKMRKDLMERVRQRVGKKPEPAG